MRELFILIAHLLVTLAKLARPGGLGAVAAESLAVKHQLLIMKRAQRRAPNLTSWDRLVLGVCALFVSPKRLSKMAVILKASTLLCFHHALVRRKYHTSPSSRIWFSAGAPGCDTRAPCRARDIERDDGHAPRDLALLRNRHDEPRGRPTTLSVKIRTLL
jgi:hypothetical protein